MKTKLLVKSLLIAGFLAVVCGYPMQASALPLEPFSFHQHSGFMVDSTLVGTALNTIGWYDTPGLTPAPVAGTFDTIAWGVPYTVSGGGLKLVDPLHNSPTGSRLTEFSGLQVIGHAGTVTTGIALGGGGSDWGAWQSISTVYHQNRDISLDSATLTNAVIFSNLVLDHSGVDIFNSPNSVPITFMETLNAGSCPNGGVNGTPCDDLFTFPNVTFAPLSFTYGGHEYVGEFQLGNFLRSTSDFPTCPGGVCTVWTAEGVTSQMDVQMRLSEVANAVPEPATLVLLGLGLLGLGFAKRREMKS